MNDRGNHNPGVASRGLTLIEAALAMVVLSVVLVSVVQGVGLSMKFQHRSGDELRGTMLAAELAERVAAYAYEEGDDMMALKSNGLNAGESFTDLSTLDDVDDWHGYTETPPTYGDGTEMTGLSGWARSVSVRWVVRSAPDTDAGSDEGAKLITVVVTKVGGGEVGYVARLVFDTADLGGD